MPFTNPDPLRYPGNAPTTGGTSTSPAASTTDASAWIQQQPWYRVTLAKWGNPNTLTLGQRGYLARTAIQAGMDPSFGISTDGRVEDWTTNNPMFWSGVAGAATLGLAGGVGAGAGGASAGAGAGSGAAGTGATVAGTTAPAAAGWFSPTNIIPSAISSITSIFGANQQANASSEAAQLQYKSTEEALADARAQRDYEKAQYANYLGRLQPYLGLGTTAGSTLQNLLARSPYTKLANNGPLPQYSTAPQGPGSSMAVQPNQAGMPSASAPPSAADIQTLQSKMGGNTGFTGGAPVMLRAPDGSTKSVDPSMVNHYLSLGAVQV